MCEKQIKQNKVTNMPINKQRLIEDLLELGVQNGDNLVLTVALSEIGRIDGGVEALINALISAVGPEGSIFGLSFTPLYRLPLSKRNAKRVFSIKTIPYTGTFNKAMVKDSRSIRSSHPSCSFVGIGSMATKILLDHTASSMDFDPVLKLSYYENSKMLLLGTIEKCPGVTTVHVAQNILNFKNRMIGHYGVNYLAQRGDDKIKLYIREHVGGCSKGFWKFYEHYQKVGALSEGKVGNAISMLASLKKTLSVDLAILKDNPSFFFCDNSLCYECRVGWQHSKTPFIIYAFRKLLAKVAMR